MLKYTLFIKIMSSERELDIRQQELDFAKKIAATRLNRAFDLQYLKLTVIIVLLIVIVFYITCKFNAKKVENVSEPQLSVLTNEQTRSDPAFDWF